MINVDIDVDTSDLLALAARAAAIPPIVNAVGAVVVGRTVKKIEASAKQGVPVLTGALRASIHGSASGLVGVIDADERYAPYVEFGTYKDTPQPFMMPALESNTGFFVSETENRVGNAIEAAL